MKNPVTLIIGALSISVVVLGLALVAQVGAPSLVSTTEASWAPEALQIVESIAASTKEYSAGEATVTRGQELVQNGELQKARAAAAAKGADLTLCAKFQARYDRATKALVADAACPLL